MCNPVLGMVFQGVLAAGSAMAQNHAANKQAEAIREQNDIQQDEIAKAAGQELTERARAARRERAAMRAQGSEMGVNLNSGSFMAALQASAQNQYNDMGVVVQNERGQQRARAAQARSLMNGAKGPSAVSSALRIGGAAYSGYTSAREAQDTASQRAAS